MSASEMPPVPPVNIWPPTADLGGPFAAGPQVIAHDQPCRKCGYNLRGLTTENRCPECGTPVGFSFHGDLLRFCDPNWVETLYRGARIFVIGVAVIFITAILTVVVAAASGSPAFALLFGLAVLAGWGLTMVGWWRMTEPDPSGLGEDQYGTARKIIRFSLVVAILQKVLEMLAGQLRLNPTAMIGLQVVSFAFGIVAVVGFFAQLNYLKKLALRIPDPKLSGRANFLMYALGGSYGLVLVVGLVMALSMPGGRGTPGGGVAAFGCFAGIVGLAVLIFAIMYLLLVERMGKRFKEQAAIARSTWAAQVFAPPAGR